ncbi:Protein kinase domain-containing protein [Mycena kentingensis (nom. inval.)]|nr:Protein kinase domain-containing protein [Mycena kentingensis (nom. inval.)]
MPSDARKAITAWIEAIPDESLTELPVSDTEIFVHEGLRLVMQGMTPETFDEEGNQIDPFNHNLQIQVIGKPVDSDGPMTRFLGTTVSNRFLTGHGCVRLDQHASLLTLTTILANLRKMDSIMGLSEVLSNEAALGPLPNDFATLVQADDVSMPGSPPEKLDAEYMVDYLTRIVSTMAPERVPTFSSSTNAFDEHEIDVHIPNAPPGRSVLIRLVSVSDIKIDRPGVSVDKHTKKAFSRLARTAHDRLARSDRRFAACDVVVIFDSGARIFRFEPTRFIATEVFDWFVDGAKVFPTLFRGSPKTAVAYQHEAAPFYPITRLTSFNTLLRVLRIHGDLMEDPERRSTIVLSVDYRARLAGDSGKCLEVMNPAFIIRPAPSSVQAVHRVLITVASDLEEGYVCNKAKVGRAPTIDDSDFALAEVMSRGNPLKPAPISLISEYIPVPLAPRYRLHAAPATLAMWKFPSTRAMTSALFDAITGHKNAYQRAGVLHGDITPTNIVLDEGDGCKGLLLDFDSARSRGLRCPDWVPPQDKKNC